MEKVKKSKRVMVKLVLGRFAFVCFAAFVMAAYAWMMWFTILTRTLTVGFFQAQLYLVVVICLYMLTKKALWSKN